MKHFSVPRLGVCVLLVTLAFPAASDAQTKAKAPAPKKPEVKQPEAPKPEFAEAELLRNAYLLLLEGDADYDGHRANAMKAVKNAFMALDARVMNYGTPQQKAATARERAAIAAAEKGRQNAPVLQEN